ncbi:MAG: polysaccharide deacetylase family protein [Armatimonadota bacterium]
MNRFLWPAVLAFLVFFISSNPCFSAGYLDTVKEALTSIEAGAYDDAAFKTEKAFALNESDPLAHFTLAIIYLHARNYQGSERELKRVLIERPDDWRAHYALGILDLLNKKPVEADKHFAVAAKDNNARHEIDALQNYRTFISGQTKSITAEQVMLPLDIEVRAMIALKQGRKDDAMNLFLQMIQFPSLPGFDENKAPVATFDPAMPFALPVIKFKWRPLDHKNAPVVTGRITLKADAKRSSGIEFVSVYIDDSFIGVTNCEPFEFDWDTSKYPNGIHQIRMEGKGPNGGVVSTKTIWAKVKNEVPQKYAINEGPEVNDLYNRIWNCLRVSESRKIAHYQLAKLYLQSGDNANAIKELEFVEAYQPGYMDAQKLLKSLKGRSAGYSEISKGQSGSKLIALTFDDGPNERTAEMLDVLDQLKIPVTFFLVGYVAETQPDMVKRIQSTGHQIENHTYSHRRLNDVPDNEVESELSKGAAVIKAITGQSSLYFRPPGGHTTNIVKQAAAHQGFTSVFWTLSCSPYEGQNYEGLASYVIDNASDGAVVLMHNGEPATTSALRKIVPQLQALGYRFVTISEMASNNNKQMVNKPSKGS